MDEIKGVAMGMLDGVWKLVHAKQAGVVRVGVRAPGGQFVQIAVMLVNGESKWCVKEGVRDSMQEFDPLDAGCRQRNHCRYRRKPL